MKQSDSYDKSKAIQHLQKIEEQVIQKAKQSGSRDEMKKAEQFAKNLHKEENFHRYSK